MTPKTKVRGHPRELNALRWVHRNTHEEFTQMPRTEKSKYLIIKADKMSPPIGTGQNWFVVVGDNKHSAYKNPLMDMVFNTREDAYLFARNYMGHLPE
jgi:hypothetical protein